MNLDQAKQQLVFECVSGSHAYGTNTPESDTDIRAVFTVSPLCYLRLDSYVEQVTDTKNDVVYYTLKRFFELAADNNPNILELLFMPVDCVLKTSPLWEKVVANRQAFVSKRAIDTYCGYAVSQIKRARGQNKKVNNPMPETKPTKEDFCWVLLHTDDVGNRHSDTKPFRPVKLNETSVNLSYHHCSAVEHVSNMYRLYYYGESAKGVFRGDESADIVCADIPIKDELDKFTGLLIYHKDSFEKELRQWHQYWDWRKNRNESRWLDQENGKVDYDAKNLSHCMRLLYEGENIVKYGFPKVRFDGEQLQHLRDIRFAKLPYEEIIVEAEERLAYLN
ncbi:MAG: nucleotidyltransferase domain-containing protein, partial [Planctomycetaceae bacterium]|nr:nucleotidyltransferase domain-containing protein [Planctomycetaceae bacterium]